MEIWQLKNITAEIKKTSVDGLNSRMEMTEERIREDDCKTVAIAWFEQQRESRL